MAWGGERNPLRLGFREWGGKLPGRFCLLVITLSLLGWVGIWSYYPGRKEMKRKQIVDICPRWLKCANPHLSGNDSYTTVMNIT